MIGSLTLGEGYVSFQLLSCFFKGVLCFLLVGLFSWDYACFLIIGHKDLTLEMKSHELSGLTLGEGFRFVPIIVLF